MPRDIFGAGEGIAMAGGAIAPLIAVTATTTWNASDKTAAVTVSNGNLTAAMNATTQGGVRTIASHSSGKFYAEFNGDTIVSVITSIGMSTGAFDMTSGYPGDATGLTFFAVGSSKVNGSFLASSQSFTTGNIVQFAVDLTAKLAWLKITTSDWNGSSSNDPATGVGGYDISAIATGALFISFNSQLSGDAITANFGGSAYAGTQPSGYGNW